MTSKEALEKWFNTISTQDKIRWEENYKLINKDLEVLEIIKNHILKVGSDISGIYLKKHYNGLNEPYYTIEIKDGINKLVSTEEYSKLKEWYENE